MKKLKLVFLQLLFPVIIFANGMSGVGHCGTSAFYSTHFFDNGREFEIRNVFNTDSIVHYTAPLTGNTDTTISFPQMNVNDSAGVQWRYKLIDGTWSAWSGYIPASNDTYAGCGTLAVEVSHLSATRTGNTLNFSFTGEQADVNYVVKISNDNGNSWKAVKTFTGMGQHSAIIDLSLYSTLFFLPLLVWFKTKKVYDNNNLVGSKLLLSFLLFAGILTFISCKKESIATTSTTKQYNLMKVSVESKDAMMVSETEIIKF